jgi:hypothetical protein
MELMEMSCRRPGEQVLRPELHLIRVGEDRRRPWTRTKCLLGGLIATLERSGFEVIAKGVLGASIISKSVGKPYAAVAEDWLGKWATSTLRPDIQPQLR